MKEATEKSIKEEKAVLEEIIEIPVEVEQIAIFTGNPERVQSQINRWLLENHDRIEITERVQSPYWINQSGIVVSIFFKTKK